MRNFKVKEDTVKRENLAHTYLSANASASTIAHASFLLKNTTTNVVV